MVTSTRRFLALRRAVSAFFRRFLRAQTDHVNAIDRNIVLRHQVLHHAVRAPPAESGIIFRRTVLIGKSFYRDEVVLQHTLVGYQVVKLLLRFGASGCL